MCHTVQPIMLKLTAKYQQHVIQPVICSRWETCDKNFFAIFIICALHQKESKRQKAQSAGYYT